MRMGEPQSQKTAKVSVAQEVIASIAGIAASEVEGFERLSGGLTAIFSDPTKGRGVETQLDRNSLRVSMKVIIKYGYPLHEVARRIQSRVKQEVEAMTGLKVGGVDVYVQDVQLPQQTVKSLKVESRKSEGLQELL